MRLRTTNKVRSYSHNSLYILPRSDNGREWCIHSSWKVKCINLMYSIRYSECRIIFFSCEKMENWKQSSTMGNVIKRTQILNLHKSTLKFKKRLAWMGIVSWICICRFWEILLYTKLWKCINVVLIYRIYCWLVI